MGKPKMPHPLHEQHLCYLHNLGLVKSDLDEYSKLVRDAKFICRKCGRAAAGEKSLCKPASL